MDHASFKAQVACGDNQSALFDRIPPEDPGEAELLFVDREKERKFALGSLTGLIRSPKKQILAVVGLARVGKSHFLTLLYTDPVIAKEFGSVIRLRLSESPDTLSLLREAWKQIQEGLLRYLGQLAATKWEGADRAKQALETFNIINERFGPMIYGTVATEVQISFKQSEIDQLQTQISRTSKGAALMGLTLKFLAKAEASVEHSRGKQETQGTSHGLERTFFLKATAYTAPQIRDLIGLAHELVRTVNPQHRTLLVVDDFDLLRRDPTGNLEPSAMLAHLYHLAQGDGFYVLTTVRKDTYQTTRHSFHQLVEITPLPEQQRHAILKEIYDRHIHRYNNGQDPFSSAFVDSLARGGDGRIGVYMEILRRAYEDQETNRVPTINTLRAYLDHLWSSFETENPELTAELIGLVVNKQTEVLTKELADKLHATSLIEAVTEDYSSTNRLILKRYFADYLREKYSKP